MGFHIIDSYTFSHFFFGFICKLVIFSNIPLYSFIISNGIHLIVEINEHNYDNNNKQLESFTNHLGDVIAFFIVWYLCYYFNYNLSSKKKLDVFLKYFLLSIIFIGLYSETSREIYPYHKGYIFGLCKGAFTK